MPLERLQPRSATTVLQIRRVKRVALTDIAGLVAAAKPADALFGSAVGKRIGHDVTARSGLESVVANRAGRVHRFFNVARFDNVLHPVGIPGPNASQEIGLELEADRELIVFRLTHPTARRLRAIRNTEQILHVMPNFVGYDVRFREITSGTQALLELTEKTEVDVNALILRTIERTARATGESAPGPHHVREENEPRLFVLSAHLVEEVMPRVFGVGQNDGDKL